MAGGGSAGGWKRCINGIWRAITSTIGLSIVFIGYSFLGAVIFQAIEAPHESTEKASIVDLREEIVTSLSLVSGVKDPGAFSNVIREELKKYEGQIQNAFAQGVNTDSEDKVWDLWGSLFYCATITTTIGYGNIAPATDLGRIVTIIYALIGIPLCLIFIAHMGKTFTKILKALWSPFQRCLSSSPYSVDDQFNLPPLVAILVAVAYMLLGAVLFMQWEEWTYLEAFYFVFISISTIGFGDILPEHPLHFMASFIYLLIGLALIGSVIEVIMEVVGNTLGGARSKMAGIGIPVNGIFAEEKPKKKKE